MMWTNKVYDALKWNVMIFIPAFISMIATLGQTFQWWFLPELLSVLTAINTFLGTLIGVSNFNYNLKETYNGEEEKR